MTALPDECADVVGVTSLSPHDQCESAANDRLLCYPLYGACFAVALVFLCIFGPKNLPVWGWVIIACFVAFLVFLVDARLIRTTAAYARVLNANPYGREDWQWRHYGQTLRCRTVRQAWRDRWSRMRRFLHVG